MVVPAATAEDLFPVDHRGIRGNPAPGGIGAKVSLRVARGARFPTLKGHSSLLFQPGGYDVSQEVRPPSIGRSFG